MDIKLHTLTQCRKLEYGIVEARELINYGACGDNGNITGFQPDDTGSIPVRRSTNFKEKNDK